MSIYKNDNSLYNKLITALKAISLNVSYQDKDGTWHEMDEITDDNKDDGKPKNLFKKIYNPDKIAEATNIQLSLTSDNPTSKAKLKENMEKTEFEDSVPHKFQSEYDSAKTVGMWAIVKAIAKEVVDFLIENTVVAIEKRFNDLDTDFNNIVDYIQSSIAYYDNHKNDVVDSTPFTAVETAVDASNSNEIEELDIIQIPGLPSAVPSNEQITNKLNEVIQILNNNKIANTSNTLTAINTAVQSIEEDLNTNKQRHYIDMKGFTENISTLAQNTTHGARKSKSAATIESEEKLADNNGNKVKISIK